MLPTVNLPSTLPPTGAGYRIFICYRRSDAQDSAGRLALELINRVPLKDEEVFVDTQSLNVGEKWKEKIHDTIIQLHALIAVISPDWTKPDAEGILRINRRNDPVRVELETAFEAGIRILPVLVRGARMPRREELPKKLRGLPDLQALELRHEHYKRDVQPLVESLRALTRAPATARRITIPRTMVRSPIGHGLSPIGAWAAEDRAAWFAAEHDRARVKEEARAERRLSLPAFYERPAWWISIVVTFVATLVAVIGSEFLLDWAAGLFGVTRLSTVGWPILLVDALAWAVTYVAVATAYYAYDPGRGARTFYTRGLFGGWALAFYDEEEGGLSAAFPLNMGVAWIGARLAALGLDIWLDVDQIGFFVLILGIVSIVAIATYLLGAVDAI